MFDSCPTQRQYEIEPTEFLNKLQKQQQTIITPPGTNTRKLLQKQLNLLHEDQSEIVYYILKRLNTLINNPSEFTPVQMTISGKAGTGKSILLETIANIFIHLFDNPNACKITALLDLLQIISMELQIITYLGSIKPINRIQKLVNL